MMMQSSLAALAALVLSATPLAAAPQWTALGPYGGFVDTLTVDPVDTRVLYATADLQGTFKSADGGATWSASNRGLPNAQFTVLAVDPAKRTRIYLAADGIWHSLDGGFSWMPARRPVPKDV